MGRVIEADQPRASLKHHAAFANEEFVDHIPSQINGPGVEIDPAPRADRCLLTDSKNENGVDGNANPDRDHRDDGGRARGRLLACDQDAPRSG
ncbi:hypothetical protein [Bradyrhizobium sp.]|uniref:hypothetical protein n=1 Tax=Bradyrhizobium sp. TaxID=376 RepID=UPI003C74C7BE